jgi:3-oxoacyl-[acyl-carrier protein] reductase
MVLGAGGGLGGAIGAKLIEEGARIASCDLNTDAIPSELTKAGPAVRLDLRDPEQAASAVDMIEAQLGSVEILVNVTGGPPPSTAKGVAPVQWLEHFEAMVVSVIALSDRVLPGMRVAGWGRIVTCTSSGVLAPIPTLGISNTLRSSLHAWSKTLSSEVAAEGITVNTVVPGRIATRRIAELDRDRAEKTGKSLTQVERESTATIPVGRYGRPEEFASAVAFLCGVQASYITGSVLRVDGGMIPAV